MLLSARLGNTRLGSDCYRKMWLSNGATAQNLDAAKPKMAVWNFSCGARLRSSC